MTRARALVPWLALVIGILAMGALAWPGRSARTRTALPTRTEVFRETLARFDSDSDGSVSLAEWTRYGGDREMFAIYDFNIDGCLDVTELEAMLTTVRPRPSP